VAVALEHHAPVGGDRAAQQFGTLAAGMRSRSFDGGVVRESDFHEIRTGRPDANSPKAGAQGTSICLWFICSQSTAGGGGVVLPLMMAILAQLMNCLARGTFSSPTGKIGTRYAQVSRRMPPDRRLGSARPLKAGGRLEPAVHVKDRAGREGNRSSAIARTARPMSAAGPSAGSA